MERYAFPFVEQMVSLLRNGDYENAFCELKHNYSDEAGLCLKAILKYILYSLSTAKEVGYDIHSADDVMAAGFNWCPPLAMIEALGGKECFAELCKERIEESWLSLSEQEELLNRVEKSKYDFRRFVKAKR